MYQASGKPGGAAGGGAQHGMAACVATRLRYIYLKICDERQKEKLRSALDQNWPRYISQYPADAPGVARTTSRPNGAIFCGKVPDLDSNTIKHIWFHMLCH